MKQSYPKWYVLYLLLVYVALNIVHRSLLKEFFYANEKFVVFIFGFSYHIAGAKKPIESIFVSRINSCCEDSCKEGLNDGASNPLILILHGGPHSVSVSGYSKSIAFLSSLGYNLLIVNYRFVFHHPISCRIEICRLFIKFIFLGLQYLLRKKACGRPFVLKDTCLSQIR